MTDLVGSKNGERNHVLSLNPKITKCGQFSGTGFPAPLEGKPLCIKCADMSPQHNSRPLPDNFKGNGRTQ